MARPRKPINLAEVTNLASRGLTEEQIGAALGISTDTIRRRKKDYAEFGEALKKGKAQGVAMVTNALFKNAQEGNVVAQIFYLKNRDPENWRERVEHTGKGGGPVETVNYTADDYRAAASKIDSLLDDD
ncbi:Uncharacterised protein [Salmonella enterica subsp. enterica]|nr:helix-turn-helix domain-containing protein [Salmonella enterica subsp. enterica]EDW6358909.1 helix-turn-helix domain-containing protein [Salmonella enterica subsp. enterica]EKC9955242.1 helix-turn-helix domain-containing protein [Salmonella enterica]SQJ25032.1 Uncharacterised protein [Salmonella enterica subsp. enterica] [Salmonella enterica subsp. enterica serovar Menston]